MGGECKKKIDIHAGAELGQAQVTLEVVVEVGIEFGVEVEACHYLPGWVRWMGRLKLN